MKNLVFVENDTPLTTSLIVAEKFKKNHRDVLKAIRELTSQMDNAINLSDTIIEAHRMDISAIS